MKKHPLSLDNGLQAAESTATKIYSIAVLLIKILVCLWLSVKLYNKLIDFGIPIWAIILGASVMAALSLIAYSIYFCETATDKQAKVEEWSDARRQALLKHREGENLIIFSKKSH